MSPTHSIYYEVHKKASLIEQLSPAHLQIYIYNSVKVLWVAGTHSYSFFCITYLCSHCVNFTLYQPCSKVDLTTLGVHSRMSSVLYVTSVTSVTSLLALHNSLGSSGIWLAKMVSLRKELCWQYKLFIKVVTDASFTVWFDSIILQIKMYHTPVYLSV